MCGGGGEIAGDESLNAPRSYASVVRPERSRVRVARGPDLEIPKTTDFLILPCDNNREKYGTSRDTKEALVRAVKPSDFDLRVKRITLARNNGVRIEAHSVDLTKMKDSSELVKAGLKIEQEIKLNPRLIIHGVPHGLFAGEVESEIVALNLKEQDKSKVHLQVVYIFPPKSNRTTTNCIVECLTPDIRSLLLREKHVYINYSACSFSDHVRVLQCFKQKA